MAPPDIQRIFEKLDLLNQAMARVETRLDFMPTIDEVSTQIKTHTAECKVARRGSFPPAKPWYTSKVGQGLGALLAALAGAVAAYIAS